MGFLGPLLAQGARKRDENRQGDLPKGNFGSNELTLAKALKLESARKDDFSMLFGSLSPIGASLMCFASPKIIRKIAPLRVAEFWNN
ncbi:MAG: hypothetical protein IJ333_00285, partial [Clostridia bacterium]|nr:hypothetical protein [Clostridia bacterium]